MFHTLMFIEPYKQFPFYFASRTELPPLPGHQLQDEGSLFDVLSRHQSYGCKQSELQKLLKLKNILTTEEFSR